MQPPPSITGLQARYFRASRNSVRARYLFDSEEGRDEFRGGALSLDPAAESLMFSEGSAAVAYEAGSLPIEEVSFDRPVFILAAPRSGSTLLFDLLSQSPSLWSLGCETQYIFEGLSSLHLANKNFQSQVLEAQDADSDTVDALRAGIWLDCQPTPSRGPREESLRPRASGLRYIDKTIENALRVPFLLKAFPDALFIYLHRDLRPNISSIVEAWNRPGFTSLPGLPGWDRKDWSFLLPEHWEKYNGRTLTEIAGFQWGSANEAILDALDTLPKDRWTSISYENLLADPQGQVARLCRFMDVDPGTRLRATSDASLPLADTTVSYPSPLKWKTNEQFYPKLIRGLQPLAGRIRYLHQGAAPDMKRSENHTEVRFSCFLDSVEEAEPQGDEVVNPSLLLQPGNSPPLTLLRKVRNRERFVQDFPLLWVEDPATRVWSPVWLERSDYFAVTRLRPGGTEPSLGPAMRRKLCGSAVLVRAQEYRSREHYGKRLADEAAIDLQRTGVCKLNDVLRDPLRQALSDYYKKMIASGDWPLGDAQVERRYAWHNERTAQFLHQQLSEFVSRVAGVALKPTYSICSAYEGSAELDAHLDREQCDYTFSLLVDEQRPEHGKAWPLWFLTPQGKRSVEFGCGDGVLFRGCEIPHWRESASSEHRQLNLLFHFVRADWAGVRD
ncbi:sulfotransferase family protein [Marinimicrobium locisalis]|uniref:sulfotransferase family protein n=1 Tax=Marinimicrobium locisalis TaxID=546022 RepID=UPI003221DA0F